MHFFEKKSAKSLPVWKIISTFATANKPQRHCRDGGICRRAGLKHQWSNPSRFDPGTGVQRAANRKICGSFFCSHRFHRLHRYFFDAKNLNLCKSVDLSLYPHHHAGDIHPISRWCYFTITLIPFYNIDAWRHNNHLSFTCLNCNWRIYFLSTQIKDLYGLRVVRWYDNLALATDRYPCSRKWLKYQKANLPT